MLQLEDIYYLDLFKWVVTFIACASVFVSEGLRVELFPFACGCRFILKQGVVILQEAHVLSLQFSDKEESNGNGDTV